MLKPVIFEIYQISMLWGRERKTQINNMFSNLSLHYLAIINLHYTTKIVLFINTTKKAEEFPLPPSIKQ